MSTVDYVYYTPSIPNIIYVCSIHHWSTHRVRISVTFFLDLSKIYEKCKINSIRGSF